MRLSALLLAMLAAEALGQTVTIQSTRGPMALWCAVDWKLVRYANLLRVTCPATGFQMDLTGCARPRLVLESADAYRLVC